MKAGTHEKLSELLDFAKSHNLVELSWQEEDTKIAFRRRIKNVSHASTDVPSNGTEPVAEPISTEIIIKSPMVGTFRRAVSKDRPPLVMEADHVKPGDRLGVVECMKIPTDVVSVAGGKIVKIFVDEGHVVEYGQPLFAIEPSDENPAVEN